MDKILIRELVDIICDYLDIRSIINFHISYDYPLSVKWILIYKSYTSYNFVCDKCDDIESIACNICTEDICKSCKDMCENCNRSCCDNCISDCDYDGCDDKICSKCLDKCYICSYCYCPRHMATPILCCDCDGY